MRKTSKILMISLFLMFIFQVPVFAASKTITVYLKTNTSNVSKSLSTGTYKVRAIYDDALLYNDVLSSTTSNSSVAYFSNGYIKAKKSGNAVITIKYSNKKAKIKLTVKSSGSGSVESTGGSLIRANIVKYAKSFVGVLPYVYGGNSLKTGTDCSGFIHLIYDHFGYSVPRTASDFQSMSNTTYNNLEPGDVVVYKNGGHVALYIGNDEVVHAQGTAYGTRQTSMWYNTPTGYVKIIR